MAYERKECVHAGKMRCKEQYSPANIDVWIRDFDMKFSMLVKSAFCSVAMSYPRGACGVTRWEGESNESMYETNGMEAFGNGVKWNE